MKSTGIQNFAEIQSEAFSKLPFVLAHLGESEKQSPINRPNGFEWHEFIWVKHGIGTFTVRDERFILEEGYGIFIRANVPHTYEGNPFHTRWCTFSADSRVLDYVLGSREFLCFSCPTYLESETDTLIRTANSAADLMARSAAGYAFVTDLFLTITRSEISPDVRTAEFLETHYSEAITLDDIASAVGVDKYALCRDFRQKRGISIMEHLKQIRIAKAKRFLRYSSESVAEIGRMCGFESASYFIKRFGEVCACTPREYRERHEYS